MTFSKLRALVVAVLVGLPAFSLVGCGGSSNNDVTNVRVFNGVSGSASAGGINVALRQLAATPVNLSPVPYGAISFTHRPASASAVNTYMLLANNSQTQIAVQKYDYPADNITANTTGVLLVADGVVGKTDSNQPNFIYVRGSVPLSVIRDSNGNPTAYSLFRVVNASPDTTNGITIFNEQGVPAAIPDLTGITYGNFSSGGHTQSNYEQFTAGTFNFSVRDAQSGTVLISAATIGPLAFQPGVAYTLIVYGSPANGTPFAAALIQDYPLP